MKFRTHYNFDFSEASNFESLDSTSFAVPGQSLTVKELLINHVRGISIDPISKTPIYGDDDDPDFDDIDFSRDPMRDLSDITDRLQRLKPSVLDSSKAEVKEGVSSKETTETETVE